MNENKKLYTLKQKEGTHLSEKVNSDGTRAALQFDDNNKLQGPVDLIEFDKSELVKTEQPTITEILVSELLVPVLSEAFRQVLNRGVNFLFDKMDRDVIPKAHRKTKELTKRIQYSILEKKTKAETLLEKDNMPAAYQKTDDCKVIHTADEVDEIITYTTAALCAFINGIQELSNTIIADDGTDPNRIEKIQNQLKELTSEKSIKIVEYILQEPSRSMYNPQVIQLLEAFLNKELIIEDRVVPISKYLPK